MDPMKEPAITYPAQARIYHKKQSLSAFLCLSRKKAPYSTKMQVLLSPGPQKQAMIHSLLTEEVKAPMDALQTIEY